MFFNVLAAGFQVNNSSIIFITLHEVTLHRNDTLKWFYVDLDYNYIQVMLVNNYVHGLQK